MAKIIISCAITGSIHTPTMSDALPITPDQIATQAIDAAEAGAAILHLHARDPKDGRPSPDPAVFMQFLPRIKQATDAVVNITTGGAVTMTVEQRISAANTLSPEMCSLNMGSMNFALYPMAKRYKNWKYDWEESYLTNSDAYIFPNTFRDIEKVYKTLGEGHGVKFEHECYDTGHLYNLAHLHRPWPVQAAGLPAAHLRHPRRHRPRSRQSVLHEAHRRPAVRQGLSVVGAGGRPASDEFLHLGLDDRRQCARRPRGLALYRARANLPQSNAEQVTKIRRIIEDLGQRDRDARRKPGRCSGSRAPIA